MISNPKYHNKLNQDTARAHSQLILIDRKQRTTMVSFPFSKINLIFLSQLFLSTSSSPIVEYPISLLNINENLNETISTSPVSCTKDIKQLKWQNVRNSRLFFPARYAFGVANTHKALVLMGGMTSPKGKNQTMFNDVWISTNGKDWDIVTTDPGWTPRSYFSTVYFGGKVYVMGGATVDTHNVIKADGQVWYASKPYKTFTKGTFQTNKAAGTSDVAPWGRRIGSAVAVASDKVWLFGGMTISETNTLEFYSDLYYSVEPGSSWKQINLKKTFPPIHQTGRIGAYLFDTEYLSISAASSLLAYGGGVMDDHNSDFTDDIVEIVKDVSMSPSSTTATGGTTLATDVTAFGRTMTSISTFRTNYNPLHPNVPSFSSSSSVPLTSSTASAASNGNVLVMTGGSGYSSEGWKQM